MGVKNFKRLLISIPKCIELSSELILVLGLVSHPGPRPNIYFFWGEMSGFDLEINSMHFDIEISKFLKFLTPNIFGSKHF